MAKSNVVTLESRSNGVLESLQEQIEKTPKDDSIFTTKSGVKLKLNKVSGTLLVEATKQIKDPEIPVVYLEDKERSEPNPIDPTYLSKLTDAQYERGMLGLNIQITMGTKILEVPSTIPQIEDTEWSDEIREVARINIPSEGRVRKLAWLKYVALADDTEMSELSDAILRFNGRLLEVEVSEAASSFPDTAR